MLLRWQRASGNDRSDPLAPDVADSLPADDTLDPVWFSEQDELRDALDRALATIPRGRANAIRAALELRGVADGEAPSLRRAGCRAQQLPLNAIFREQFNVPAYYNYRIDP